MPPTSNKQQERLITPVGFGLLVLVVVLLLAVLYPSKEPLFAGNHSSDELKALFKDPAKLKYKQVLQQESATPRQVLDTVEFLSEKGLWRESRHLLMAKLSNDLNENQRKEAALWMLQSHLDEYYISQDKTNTIDRPLGGARAELQRFDQLEALSVKELRLLARTSLEFGLTPQAIKTYLRLAEVDKQNRLDWLDKAGTKAMQIQYYGSAIKAYQQATTYSNNDKEYKAYLYAWLDAAGKSGDKTLVQRIVEGIERDQPKDPKELERLAKISLSIGRPSIAHRLYYRLATIDPRRAKDWYEKAGVWALSNKEYTQAAQYFFQAEKLTTNPSEIERLRYLQYEAFTEGEKPEKALEKLESLVNKYNTDKKFLQKGINAALAAKDAVTARKWNTRYLQQHPNDFLALQRQADIEIRDKQYGEAIRIVQGILRIKGKDIDNLKKLAFLQESQGDELAALAQWQSIETLEKNSENQAHILRLAQATVDQTVGLKLLLKLGKQQRLPEQAVQDIVTHYIDSQQRSKAEAFLSDYLQRYQSKRELWLRLISLQKDKPNAALATWKAIERRFSSNDESILAQMEILWMLKRKADTLAVYDAHPKTSITSRFHHGILAQLGWDFERWKLALRHYHHLIKMSSTDDKSKVSYYLRISNIHLKQKKPKAAMKNFRDAWDNTKNSDVLLQALQTAFTQRLSSDLRYFLDISQLNEALFDDSSAYWQLRAQLAFKEQQYDKAQNHYQKMLSIKPDSIVARQGIIAVLTQSKQKQALQETLIEWQTIAKHEEKLWASYALGLQALGEVKKSLPWYKYYIDKNSDDFAMLLSYADQLERLRRYDSAYRIRQFALNKLNRFLAKNKITEEQRKEALFQYLGLVQRYGSLTDFEKLQQQLKSDYTNKADQTRLNSIAVAWMLSKKQDDRARFQLIKAHELRLKTPLWQLLAVAIKRKDKQTISDLLSNAKHLTQENRVAALLALGKEQQAYQLALQGIDEKRLPKEREQARALALSVANDNASSFQTTLSQKHQGNLDLQSQGLVYRKGMNLNLPFGYDLSVRRHRLNYDDFLTTELDTSASLRWKTENSRISGTVGANRREKGNLYYAKLNYQHQLSERVTASIELGKNEVATEGSLLRIAGKRDRIKADISTKIGKKKAAQVSVWKHKFSTREGEKLADGQGLSASLIHKENIGSSQWHVGMQAQIESNVMVDKLPESINTLSNGTETIVSKSPKSVGVVAGISHGSPGRAVPTVNSPRYSANAWLGKSSTSDNLGVNLQASVGSRLLGNDELSANAFMSSVAGSNGQSDMGIQLQYQKWFDMDADNQRYRIEQ